jgi:hypothetical protein
MMTHGTKSNATYLYYSLRAERRRPHHHGSASAHPLSPRREARQSRQRVLRAPPISQRRARQTLFPTAVPPSPPTGDRALPLPHSSHRIRHGTHLRLRSSPPDPAWRTPETTPFPPSPPWPPDPAWHTRAPAWRIHSANARNRAASIHVPIGDRTIHHRSPHPIPLRITLNPHPDPETFIHLPWSLSLFGSNIREFGSVSGSDGVTGVASNADAVAMWMVSCRAPCGWCSSPQATPRLRPRCPPQHPQHPGGWAARDTRSSRSPTSRWVATASAAGIHHKTTRWRSRHRSAVSRPSAPSSSMSGTDHAIFFTSALPLLSVLCSSGNGVYFCLASPCLEVVKINSPRRRERSLAANVVCPSPWQDRRTADK